MIYSHLKKQSGLTLIELLVVLAIIGILTSVGVPSYNKFVQKGEFSKAYNNLNNAYRFARAEAIKTSSPMVLFYRSSSYTESGWQVYKQGDSGNPLLISPPPGDISVNPTYSKVIIAANGSLVTARNQFRFHDARQPFTQYICILKSGQSFKSEGACSW